MVYKPLVRNSDRLSGGEENVFCGIRISAVLNLDKKKKQKTQSHVCHLLPSTLMCDISAADHHNSQCSSL